MHSQELINALSRQDAFQFTTGIKAEANNTCGDTQVTILTLAFKPIIKVETSKQTLNDKLIAGTYCHILLIPHIVSWVSPSFGLAVSRIVNSFYANEYKIKMKAAQKEMDEHVIEGEAPIP